jgi:hypothetical protein
MPTLSLKTDPSFNLLVSTEAARAQVSKSEWVRRAVLAYAGAHSADQVKTKRKIRPGSALELAGDAVACFEGGPTDLSTNPKYMEGFGKV